MQPVGSKNNDETAILCLVLFLAVPFFMWPLMVVQFVGLHGWVQWAIGFPANVLWILLLIAGWRMISRRRNESVRGKLRVGAAKRMTPAKSVTAPVSTPATHG
jgi:hypothetical protein